jgi:hypothetical protein
VQRWPPQYLKATGNHGRWYKAGAKLDQQEGVLKTCEDFDTTAEQCAHLSHRLDLTGTCTVMHGSVHTSCGQGLACCFVAISCATNLVAWMPGVPQPVAV